MPDTSKTVFISYRRQVSSFIARAIFQHLREYGYDVFMDVENIDSGTFDTIILNQIAARAHFLVILTPGSVEGCAEPGDWVRCEIETAIDLGRNIVPVLVNNFEFSNYADKLTGKLEQLQRYSGLTLPHDYFDAAMERLRTRFLKQPMSGMIQPPPAADEEVVEEKIAEAASQPPPTEEQLSAEQYFERAYARDQSNLEGKIADYTQVIKLNPHNGAAYNNRGEFLFASGKITQALSDFERALALRSSMSDYHKRYPLAGLAVTLHALGEISEAITHWRTLLDLDGRYRDADWAGGELNWRPELIEEARKLIARL